MTGQPSLDDFSKGVYASLIKHFPEWGEYLSDRNDGLMEVVVPAPKGSKTTALVILTTDTQDIWIRFSIPHCFYSLDSNEELISVIKDILSDKVFFVITHMGGEWTGTTLINKGTTYSTTSGEIASILSWSGKNDHTR